MKTLFAALGLLAMVATAEAQAVPQAIGAQWDTRPTSIWCGMPNSGGSSCFYFPVGGQIYGITWESTLKNATDALWTLVLSSNTATAETPLFGSFQKVIGTAFKEPNLGGRYITVPAGWFVWVAVDSDFSTMQAEMNVTLWTNAVSVYHYCPSNSIWATPGFGC